MRGPFFTSAPMAVAPGGEFAYVGCHRTDAAHRASPLAGAGTLRVAGELGPGRLAALVPGPSGATAAAVDLAHETAFLFDGTGGQTLTARLTPDTDPSELPAVPVLVSAGLGAAFVADRFGDGVLVLPLP